MSCAHRDVTEFIVFTEPDRGPCRACGRAPPIPGTASFSSPRLGQALECPVFSGAQTPQGQQQITPNDKFAADVEHESVTPCRATKGGSDCTVQGASLGQARHPPLRQAAHIKGAGTDGNRLGLRSTVRVYWPLNVMRDGVRIDRYR